MSHALEDSVYTRFVKAYVAWRGEMSRPDLRDAFYAGYTAGYGAAKEDALRAMDKSLAQEKSP